MSLELIELLKRESANAHPPVLVNGRSGFCLVDLSAENHLLTDQIVNDINLFEQFIDDHLRESDADYLVGGYLEYRALYGRSHVFDGIDERSIRRLHIGLDIWGPSSTGVYAPLDGIIHSLADNNRKGDYGATIVLKHNINGIEFHSLYGHLSKQDLHYKKGDEVTKGTLFAHIGSHEENGYWPPHLHFQLIKDMQGLEGDYPGVCSLYDQEFYRQNCPDPNLLLNLQPIIGA